MPDLLDVIITNARDYPVNHVFVLLSQPGGLHQFSDKADPQDLNIRQVKQDSDLERWSRANRPKTKALQDCGMADGADRTKRFFKKMPVQQYGYRTSVESAVRLHQHYRRIAAMPRFLM